MYTFINQFSPTNEDCAALIQSLFELAKHFLPEATIAHDRRRTLELMRLVFGYLYEQSNIKYKRDQSRAFPYLALFVMKSLSCPITGETAITPIEMPNGQGIMELALAREYSTGRLRMTNPEFIGWTVRTEATALTRPSLLSGRRIKMLLHFRFDPSVSERYGDPSDEILAPIDVDVEQLRRTLSRGPFAVIPPMDLNGGKQSVLTFDERGWLAVFVGYQPCGIPPAKYIHAFHALICSTALFCPTKGGDNYVDTAAVAQALARLRESNMQDDLDSFHSLGHGDAVEAEPPNEIIMICLDTSASMDGNADFADLNDEDSDDEEEEEEEEEEDFPEYSGDKWSGQAAQGCPSIAPESLLILEYLEGCDYIQDLLRLVKVAGSASQRKIMARYVLDDLILTYKNTAQHLWEDKKTLLKDLKLLEAIDALSRESVKMVVIDYLVQRSSRIDDIMATGPQSTSDVSVLGGTFPKVTFIDKRVLIA
jgi:hypothetical protein